MVAEAGEQDRRVDDVGEDDCYRAVRGQSRGNVGLLPLNDSLELAEAGRQVATEKLDVGLGDRPVHVHDLPVAPFEMQNVGRTPVEAATRRGDLLLHAGPANSSFLPGLDLVLSDWEGTQLFELPRPDRAALVSMLAPYAARSPVNGRTLPMRSSNAHVRGDAV